MKATDDTKTQHPGSTSLGKRATPEGQSADELSAETNSRSPKKQPGEQPPNSKQKKQTQPEHQKPSSKPPNVISTQAEVHVNGDSLDKAEPNMSLFATTKEMQTTEKSLLSVPTDNARSESRTQTPMEIKNELNAPRHQEASKTDILKSHSESCLTHTGCSRAEKHNMWKRAFLLISKRRRLTRRMTYIKAFAPEILNHIKREGKSPLPSVPMFSSGDKMSRSNKPMNGSVSKTNIPQPRPVSVPVRITDRPSSCSTVSSRAKRKDKFDELCDKNCRHIGVVPPEEREDSFLPQIVPKTSSTNSRGSSSERSSSCKLPEISNVSSASPTEETNHRGDDLEEVFKHRQKTCLNLKLEPLRTKNDVKKSQRPQSENPTKVSRDSNSRRRLASVQDDYRNRKVSDKMMERIIDISRIYSSDWIQKMRERMRERTNTLPEVSERTS